MNWVDVASNQCFSGNTLQNAVDNGYFVLKSAIPSNSKMVTKDEAYSYVYINPIPSKAANQLVVKSNLTAASLLPYSYTLYLSNIDGNAYIGFDTSGQACASTFSVTVYSNSSSIAIGTALYYDAYGTETLVAAATSIDCPSTQNYFRIGNNFITFQPRVALQCDGYIINSIGTCIISYTINWDNNFITTGTNNLQILKNGILIVNQNGQGNGSFSVVSTDLITYALSSTTPNYTKAIVSVNSFGPDSRDDCNFNSAYASNTGGFYFSANGTIDGITIDYIDACP
jgi:hypothetical protein